MNSKNRNTLSRDFAIMRQKLKCVYYTASQEEQPVTDKAIAEALKDLKGIPYTDECKLYRYSQADDNNICNLCKQQLRLSEIGELNDMFEGILPANEQPTEKEWQTFGNLAYVKCFSENWDNLLMWAHYADGGRGMCVEYDLAYLNDNHLVLNHLYPVHYSDLRYTSPDFADDAEQVKNASAGKAKEAYWNERMLAYHLIKSSQWKYEQEWRIVIPAHEENTMKIKNHMISIPCISAVYLGCKMPETKKQQICSVVEEINLKNPWQIEVKELLIEEDSYKLWVK